MADFAKALERLRETCDPHPALRASLSPGERDVSRTGGRRPGESLPLAVQLQFLRTRWAKQSMQSATAPPECLPPGEIESTPLGSHYVVETIYSHDYFHGKVRLSRLSCADLEFLISLMREKAAVPPRE